MAKWRMSDKEFERQYKEAVARGREKRRIEPQAESATYDSGSHSLVIRLKNGATVSVPCSLLPEFKGADPDDIARVELMPRGTALHWEKLDQDFSVAGLLASVVPHSVLMSEVGRRGGARRSEAKTAAARANGARGGRPPKAQEARGAAKKGLSRKA
jgi:hypothetical protein